MEYTDVEFEEEFVIVPAHEPMISWVLVDEVEARELEEIMRIVCESRQYKKNSI